MEFLANENFPHPSIRLLREKGYVVVSISEESSGISDEDVLLKAVTENLVILTFDRDYGELLFKYRKESPPAVVYFRTKGQTPVEAGQKLMDWMETGITLNGHFTVMEDTGIRQRKLP